MYAMDDLSFREIERFGGTRRHTWLILGLQTVLYSIPMSSSDALHHISFSYHGARCLVKVGCSFQVKGIQANCSNQLLW